MAATKAEKQAEALKATAAAMDRVAADPRTHRGLDYASRTLCLPLFYDLTDAEIRYVARHVRQSL